MNTTEMLWIRACKSLNRQKRLKSVYRRFYSYEPLTKYNLSQILVQIVTEYELISTVELIDALNPNKYIDDKRDYWTRVADTLVSAIALTNPYEKFQGYIAPKRFRK